MKARYSVTTQTMNREDPAMSNYTMNGCACTPNSSIRCSVTSCAHHCEDAQYCGLNSIQVGTHESNPSVDQCTDCQSFEKLS